MSMTEKQLAEILSFVLESSKKVLLIKVGDQDNCASTLVDFLKRNNVNPVSISDDVGTNDLIAVENNPMQKPCIIFDKSKITGSLDKVQSTCQLSDKFNKIIYIYPASLLHPSMNPEVYFAPRKNSIIEKNQLLIMNFCSHRSNVNSRKLSNALLSGDSLYEVLSQADLTHQRSLIQLLMQRAQENNVFANYLLDYIYATRRAPKYISAASLIFEGLLEAGISLRGKDFSEISLENINIHGALLEECNFSKAHLSDIYARDVIITKSVLNGATVRNLNFGRLPNLEGHLNAVHAMAVSGDGSFLVTFGTLDEKRHLRIWNLNTFKCSFWTITDAPILSACFIKNSNNFLLLTVNKLEIWDALLGKCTENVIGDFDGILQLELTPDNNKLVGVKYHDNAYYLILYQSQNQKFIKTYEILIKKQSDNDLPPRFKISPNSQYIAINLYHSRTIRIIDLSTQSMIRKIKLGRDKILYTLCFSANSQELFTLNGFKSAVWNFKTGELLYELPFQEKIDRGTLDSIMLQNKPWFIFTSAKGDICIWDIDKHQLVNSIRAHPKLIGSILVIEDKEVLCSVGSDGVIKLWPLADIHLNSEDTLGHDGAITEVICASTSQLITGGTDGKLMIWDAKNGKFHGHLGEHSTDIHSLTISKHAQYLVSIGADGVIKLWNILDAKENKILYSYQYELNCAIFSPDGNSLVVGGYGGIILIWDTQKGVLKHQYKVNDKNIYEESIASLCFSSDGKYLFTGDCAGNIKQWDFEQYLLVDSHKSHRGCVSTLDFSPDGSLMVSGGYDNLIKFYTFDNNRLLERNISDTFTSRVHMGEVSKVKFSPDGQLVATASHDGSIALWKSETHSLVRLLSGDGSAVISLCFLPDGRHLVSGHWNRSLKCWNINNDEPHLIWSRFHTFSAANLQYENVLGLSEANKLFLEQMNKEEVAEPSSRGFLKYKLSKKDQDVSFKERIDFTLQFMESVANKNKQHRYNLFKSWVLKQECLIFCAEFMATIPPEAVMREMKSFQKRTSSLIFEAAASYRNSNLFIKIILRHRFNINSKDDIYGATALHHAVDSNNYITTAYLCHCGANVNAIDNAGRTASHIAAAKGFIKILKILQTYNADFTGITNQQLPPIFDAVSNNHLETVSHLYNFNPIKSSLNLNGKEINLLIIAVQNNSLEIVIFLIENGFDIDSQDSYKHTALNIACTLGYVDIIKYLLSQQANPYIANAKDGRPLDIAVQKGYLEIVELLFVYEEDVNKIMSNGVTLFVIAVINNHIPVAEFLINKGANPTLLLPSDMTAIEFAIQRSSLDMIKFLHQRYQNLFDSDENIFHYLKLLEHLLFKMPHVRNNRKDVFLFLISLIKNKNYQDRDSGETFLIAAIKCQYFDYIVDIATSSNINIQDKSGLSPLLYATALNFLGALPLLIKLGADINVFQPSTGDTPLIVAAQNGYEVIVELLCLRRAKINLQDKKGFTALITAAQNGCLNVVKILLKFNADCTLSTYNYGTTALHSAAMQGHTDVLKCLIDYGVDVTLTNKYKENILFVAAANQQFDTVMFIVENCKEININEKNIQGAAPITAIAKVDNAVIFKYLYLKGADIHIEDKDKNSLFKMIFVLKRMNVLSYLIEVGFGEIFKKMADAHYEALTSIDVNVLEHRQHGIVASYHEMISACELVYQLLNKIKKPTIIPNNDKQLSKSLDGDEKELQEAMELSLQQSIPTTNIKVIANNNSNLDEKITQNLSMVASSATPTLIGLIDKTKEGIADFLIHDTRRIMLIPATPEVNAGQAILQHLEKSHHSIRYINYTTETDLEDIFKDADFTKISILIIDNAKLSSVFQKYHLEKLKIKIIIFCNSAILHSRLDASVYFVSYENKFNRAKYFVQLNFLKGIAVHPNIKNASAETSNNSRKNEQNSNSTKRFKDLFLNKKFFSKESDIMRMLADRLSNDVKLRELAKNCILNSRDNPDLQIIASNFITAICYAGITLSNEDLSGINIPFAVLYYGRLFGTKLINANLFHVIFYNTILNFADLSLSNMQGVQFNDLPFIKKERQHTNVFIFSNDGEYFIANNFDKIEIYTFSSLAKLFTLSGHDDVVTAIVSHPTKLIFASASADKTIKLWDFNSKSLIATFQGHTSKIFSLSFDITGKWLVSGGKDKTIRLWDTVNYKCIEIIEKHKIRVMQVQFSRHDATLFATAAHDGSIYFWRIISGEAFNLPPRIIRVSKLKIKETINSMCLSPTAPVIAVGLNDGAVIVHNYLAQTHDVLSRHKQAVFCLTFNNNGNILASGGEDEFICIWDLAKAKDNLLNVYSIHTLPVTCLQYHPKQPFLLATASKDGTNKFLHTNSALKPIDILHSGSVFSVALSKNRLLVATGDQAGLIVVWFVATGQIKTLFDKHKDGVLSMDFNSDSTRLASASRDRSIIIWDVIEETALYRMRGHLQWVSSVRFLPDNNFIISGSWDSQNEVKYKTEDGITKISTFGMPPKDTSNMRLWDLSEGKCIYFYKGHTQQISAIDINKSISLIVSSSFDNTLCLWNLTNNELITKLEKHKHWVNTVKFNQDGTLIASGDHHGDIIIWDTLQQKVKLILNGHNDVITGLYFFADQPILVSCSHDRTVRLWNILTGEEQAKFYMHSAAITGIEVDVDYNVFTVSDDHTIKCWKLIKEEFTFQIKLIWSSPGALDADGCKMDGIKNLSEQNKKLLDLLKGEEKKDEYKEKLLNNIPLSMANLLANFRFTDTQQQQQDTSDQAVNSEKSNAELQYHDGALLNAEDQDQQQLEEAIKLSLMKP